jgi:hypothetical protein
MPTKVLIIANSSTIALTGHAWGSPTLALFLLMADHWASGCFIGDLLDNFITILDSKYLTTAIGWPQGHTRNAS